MLSGIDMLLAQSQCRDVVLAAAHAVDEQQYEALVALFSEDAVLVRPGGQPLRGRAEILASYQAKSPSRLTRHVVSNHRVTVVSGSSAQSHCTVLLYVSDTNRPLAPQGRLAEAAHQLGQIVDQLVNTPDGWRIQERKAWFDFQIGASPSAPPGAGTPS